MAYDAQSDRVVLFGGDTGSAWLGDTWAYDADGDTWVEVTTEEAPWPVAQQAMAYDPAADRIVLWGGAEREESVVWTFDLESATWSSAIWDPAPEPASDACLVWDAAAEQMLLIGGEGLTTVQISAEITAREVRLRDEVWALDLEAGAWTLLGRLPDSDRRPRLCRRSGVGRSCRLEPATGCCRWIPPPARAWRRSRGRARDRVASTRRHRRRCRGGMGPSADCASPSLQGCLHSVHAPVG